MLEIKVRDVRRHIILVSPISVTRSLLPSQKGHSAKLTLFTIRSRGNTLAPVSPDSLSCETGRLKVSICPFCAQPSLESGGNGHISTLHISPTTIKHKHDALSGCVRLWLCVGSASSRTCLRALLLVKSLGFKSQPHNKRDIHGFRFFFND
jgi:hypothetical protein